MPNYPKMSIKNARSNKMISEFWVMGLKILGRVETQFFFTFFFLEKT